ncbi:hypothetical protein [Natrinema halophilum]|uniref:hypothetical protein n=1 Tax=Natrinema halophilum TaxID=1699371 RepID=UPI001F351982|nr:hypothetical protein [Natrinema halophilum]UHQ96150.1 hypothetical protein HYG82_22790 [Natrinema halophilum]
MPGERPNHGISRRRVIGATRGIGLTAVAGCLGSSGLFSRGASDESASLGDPPTIASVTIVAIVVVGFVGAVGLPLEAVVNFVAIYGFRSRTRCRCSRSFAAALGRP